MRSNLRRRVLVLVLFFLAQVVLSTAAVFYLARQSAAAGERFQETLALYRLTHALHAGIHKAAMAANDHLIAGAPASAR